MRAQPPASHHVGGRPHEDSDGPPFAVHEDEVMDLYGRDWQVDVRERRDILHREPSFLAEGISALHTCAYALHKQR